jgi:hypothetical protein
MLVTKTHSIEEKVVTADGVQEKLYITVSNAAAAEFTYGGLISKQWLLDHFAMNEPKTGTKKDFEDFAFEFMQNIEGLKWYMLEHHKMYLDSVRGKGYLIIMPNQQSDVAMSNLRKFIYREISKAVSILSNVNYSLLTDDEIRLRDAHQGRLAGLSSFTKKRLIKN